MPVARSRRHADRVRSRLPRSLCDTGGLTLPEILVSMAILTIGLLGMAAALIVSTGGVSAGLNGGQGAIERGNAVSTATMLAQERLEQVRRVAYTAGVDQITTASFPAEAFDSINGYPSFSRTVTIQDDTPSSPGVMKTVTVTVRYRYAATAGMNEEGLVLSTIIARRP